MPALPGLHGAVHRCEGLPALAKERKRREKDGLEITPIGASGYFIPIHPAKVEEQIAPRGRAPIHACLAEAAGHPGTRRASPWKWVVMELRDHLWPLEQRRLGQRAGTQRGRFLAGAGSVHRLGHGSEGRLSAWRADCMVVRLERIRSADSSFRVDAM